MAEEKNKVEQASTEAQTDSTAPELTITDLAALRSIIEVASQRGAFKANELEAVGKTFNKLNNFLASVTPANQQAA